MPFSCLPSRPGARILDPARAKGLIALGWTAADLHVHTLHSHDVIPTRLVDPLTLYQEARRLGMTFVVFTDHDSMNAYDQIGWTREGLVPAAEIKILDRKRVGHTLHINVYCLDRVQFCEILRIAQIGRDVECLVSYLKDEHLPYVFNHPFWHEPGEKPNLGAILDIVDLFPVLEYNMGRIDRINEQALRLARTRGRGVVATTDTHVGEIGRAFSIGRGGTFREFFENIRSGQSFIVPADLNISRFKQETTIRLSQLFNKSGWLHSKDSLSIDTGNPVLDRIVTRLAQARPGTAGPAKLALRIILEGASRSGVPGSLYLRSQRNLADEISGFLERAEAAA
jgi:predicted metal-dependent phosphoesterase TrpH